jgi:hypothetical protein
VRKRLLILAGVAGLILAGVVLAAAVMVAGALDLHAYRQKVSRGRLIDRVRCYLIKEGMSRAEVEAILGGQPGDFRTEKVTYGEHLEPVSDWGVGGEWRVESWAGDRGKITVVFDEQGQVRQRRFGDPNRSLPSLPERVRAWLRRLWPWPLPEVAMRKKWLLILPPGAALATLAVVALLAWCAAEDATLAASLFSIASTSKGAQPHRATGAGWDISC